MTENGDPKLLPAPLLLTEDAFRSFGMILNMADNGQGSESADLRYCPRVLEFPGVTTSFGWMVCKKRQPVLSQMERHQHTAELLVNLAGTCVLAVSQPTSQGAPQKSDITCFFLPSGTAIVLNPGVWHWAPFPLEEDAHYLVGFAKGTEEDDLLIVDLETPIEVALATDSREK